MDKFLSYRKFLKEKERLALKKDKFAVITGGCGRIGSIFTGQLLYRGYKVICLYKTNKKYFSKIDIERCLATVRPPLRSGDIEYVLYYQGICLS